MDNDRLLFQSLAIISIFFLIALASASIVKARDCANDSDCNDQDPCTRDACRNATDCPEGCTITNCTTCTTRFFCTNAHINGCDSSNYIGQGASFSMGVGACQDTYRYDSFDTISSNVVISGIPRSYDKSNATIEGYSIRISKANDQVFLLRINETTGYLFLEDVEPACPLKDFCVNFKDCDDKNACTIDDCQGVPLRCIHKPILYCRSGDGCCPAKCNVNVDSDCKQCNIDKDCDDNRSDTKDICNTTAYQCIHLNISTCINNDSYCPAECNYTNDNDCKKPAVYVPRCGDGKCEGNETKENCCNDCGCTGDFKCANNACIRTDQQKITDVIENDSVFAAKQDALEKEGYAFSSRQITRQDNDWIFTFTYTKASDQKLISGKVTNSTMVEVEKQSTDFMPYILIGFGLLLIITLLLLFIRKSPKEKGILEGKSEDEQMKEQLFSDNESYSQGEEEKSYFKDEGTSPDDEEDDASAK